MKNLVNCSPVEFLRQTNKIRHEAESWVKGIDLKSLQRLPDDLVVVTDSMTTEEKEKTERENREKIRANTYRKISNLLDRALDEHAEETVNMMALMCFIEPDKVNDVGMITLLNEITTMLCDKTVLDFLSSLIRLGQTDFGDIQ